MSLVTLVRSGAVAIVTLNNPSSRNVLSGHMADALKQAFAEIASDPSIRAVVLTANGPVFCAGGDLKELGALPLLRVRDMLRMQLWPALRAIYMLDRLVVVALNGPVVGAGIGLALAGDIIIASETAQFILAFGQVGAMPDAGIIHLLVNAIGAARTRKILYGSGSLTAQEALAFDLYADVVPAQQVQTSALLLAQQLAQRPGAAVGLTKHAIREAARMSLGSFMEFEANSQAYLYATDDFQEGIRASQEKRPPQFHNK